MVSSSKVSRSSSGLGSAPGSVERAFGLLQIVVAAGEPVGVREIGRRTGLPPSTTSRFVAQLSDLGMVERTPDGSVVPGSALATLAVDGPTPLLADRLRPLLLSLVADHGESAALAVDDGDAVLYISQVAADRSVTAPDVQSERHPFHVVAHGLALMAYWPEDRLADYLSRPLLAATSESMVDPKAIRKRLKQIRTQGFVWTVEEFDIDVNGLAAVVTQDGEALASVGLYGPSYRLAPALLADLATELVSTVSRQAPILL